MADSVQHLAYELTRGSLSEQDQRLSVACVGAAVYVLLPHELVLEFRGSVVNELEYERGGGLDAAYEAVTEWLEDFHESNAGTLRGLGRWYTIACAALGVEVLLWTLSITDTL